MICKPRSILSVLCFIASAVKVASITCPSGQKLIEVNFNTDYYSYESSWSVTNICTNTKVLSGGPYPNAEQLYNHQLCVPIGGFYDFTVYDSYYNGICYDDDYYDDDEYYLDGSFEVRYGGNRVVTSSCDFKASESHKFGDITACPCAAGTKRLEVTFRTDYYPDENSWNVTNLCTDTVVLSGGSYVNSGTNHYRQVCVEDGIYDFTVVDSYYDGMCHTDDDYYQDGFFAVKYNGVQVVNGTCDFEASVSYSFGNSGISCAPSNSPTFQPSNLPSVSPSAVPTSSSHPTIAPTAVPSFHPTSSSHPTIAPTAVPSFHPTMVPSESPSALLSASPSTKPSVKDEEDAPTSSGRSQNVPPNHVSVILISFMFGCYLLFVF